MSHIYNFKDSDGHISKKIKQEKGEINFNNIFYLTQYIQNIVTLIIKILLPIYFMYFFQSRQNLACSLHLQHI